MGLISQLKRLWRLSEEPSWFPITEQTKDFNGVVESNGDFEIAKDISKMAIVVDMSDPLDEFPNEEEPK